MKGVEQPSSSMACLQALVVCRVLGPIALLDFHKNIHRPHRMNCSIHTFILLGGPPGTCKVILRAPVLQKDQKQQYKSNWK